MFPIAEKARIVCDQAHYFWTGDTPTTHDFCESCEHIAIALRSQDSEAFTRGKIDGLEEALKIAHGLGRSIALTKHKITVRIAELRQQSQKPQEKP